MIPSSCVHSLTESFRLENSRRHLLHSSHCTRTPALRTCCSLGEYVSVLSSFYESRWTLIFTGVSAIHISKWDVMVIRAHHWIWEKMDALEAFTIHLDRLADLAFTGATFLYAEIIVTHLTAVIKEGLQLWLPLKSRLVSLWSKLSSAR